MKKFADLYEFIDRAVKSRKYPVTTASALRSALKLFEAQLHDEEHDSLEKFEENFEQIYRDVCAKNATKFSASSLSVYKSRALKVLSEYKRYGEDPTKMAGWSPRVIERTRKSVSPQQRATGGERSHSHSEPDMQVNGSLHKIELAIRPDAKIVIMVPRDLTDSECTTIKAILDSLVIK